MSRDATLLLLLERAQGDYAAAAQALGSATGQLEQQRQKQTTLEHYRTEYVTRMEHSARLGTQGAALVNFRAFLAQLDQALAQQRQLRDQAEQHLIRMRTNWQEAHRRLQSYQILQDRRASATARLETRRDQRESDAYAQRMARSHPRNPTGGPPR